METPTFLEAFLGILAAVQAILLVWLKFGVDAKLEQIRVDQRIKERAELVGELVAEWIADSQDRKHINRLSFDAFLWLPEPIAVEVSKLLSYDKTALDTKSVLLKVRKHLLGADDKLEAWRIIHFEKPKP